MLRRLCLPFFLCALVPLFCTCDRAPKTLFRERTDTGISSFNQLHETEGWNIVEYLYFYNGGGVAATDISGDGLPDLYFTNNQGPNKYYINEGNFRFRDATEAGGVAGAGQWTTGASVVDVNRDGRMDIYVCNVSGYQGLTGKNELFLQNEDGTFTEAAADYGLDFAGFNTQAYWFDYDRDGDLDMYLLRHSVHDDAAYGTAQSREIPDSLAGDLLLRNDLSEQGPEGLQTSILPQKHLGLGHPSPAGGDLERGRGRGLKALSGVAQGKGREVRQNELVDRLLRKDTSRGTGEASREAHGLGRGFTNVTTQANLYSSKIGYGLSAAIADFDQDSFPDIYVCNDFSENDYLYLNQRDGTFKESIRERTGQTSNFSMGSDVADFDGDRRPDLLTLDMRPGQETILKSTASADAINDYQRKRAEGFHHQLPRNHLQWNRGNGNFSDVAELAGLAATDWSWSCLVEDFDLDGRPDVFVANGIERRPNSLDYLKFVSSDLARSASNLEVIAAMPPGRVANQAFRMTGEWAFTEVGADWGLDFVGSTTGAAVADFDQDGDADLVINNVNAPAKIYENTHVAPDRPLADAFNPIGHPPRRYDPDTRLCPQRGMLSQSEGRYGPDRGTAAKYPPQFTVMPTGVFRRAEVGDFFAKDPLAPYKPKPANNPVVVLENGDVAVSTDESGRQYDVLRWQEGKLLSLGLQAWPALKHRMVKDQATVSLRVPLTRDGEGLYARPFGNVGMLLPGSKEVIVAPEQTGIWQSLTALSGQGEAGTRLLAGNWGLNSGLGNPTAAAPLRLYLEDVDDNGDEEPLLTYVRQGKEYPLADKDELAARIPALRRNNLGYADFAAQSFGELFPDLKKAPLTVSTLHHLLLTRQNGQQWRIDTLPRAAQLTPVNAALEIPAGILLGGNKEVVQPRIGRQAAAALQLLTPDGRVEFIDLGWERNRVEVRQLVRLDEDHVLVVVAEGEHLVLGWR